jgi:pimeloyl-ACP methyl ester carboxylesterase
MPIAHVNGCGLFYEIAGRGPPLVFVHGETHGTRLFEAQMSYFSRTHTCLAYDRRGHAKSEVPPYGYSLWNQTHDLKCLLDFVGIDRAVVVAVAMASTIGATFALHYPERVKGLVLCSWYELDGFPLLEERRKAHQMSFANLHLRMRKIQLERGRAGLEAYLEQNHATLLPIFPPDKPEVRRELVALFACHAAEHYVQSAEFYTSMPNLRVEMHRVKCPVLGICGTDDPSPDRPELMRGVAHFRQEWIKGARRFTMMEYPDAYNAILERFLAQCNG